LFDIVELSMSVLSCLESRYNQGAITSTYTLRCRWD